MSPDPFNYYLERTNEGYQITRYDDRLTSDEAKEQKEMKTWSITFNPLEAHIIDTVMARYGEGWIEYDDRTYTTCILQNIWEFGTGKRKRPPKKYESLQSLSNIFNA